MADVKKILENMTIEQKVGQLVQFNAMFFVNTEAEITGPMMQYFGLTEENLKNIGSVLNFSNGKETMEIQKKHLAEDPNGIPVMFMMDVIHGFRTIYPIPLALGGSFDPELVEECTRMVAKEAALGGVHVSFAPMVDYVRDPRWGRVMETCGEDVLVNSRMGVAQVKGFQEEGIATCVKHFAAYGGAEAGRDYNTVELSEHVLREHYLPAYKACIDAGVDMLMPSFNSLNGVPATVNPWLMKKILKDEWNFQGVVISDYNAIGELRNHGITNDKKVAAKLAFENGCDIEMCSSTYFQHLKELVEEGTFTMEQLDEAVLRVLNLKNKLGLFEDPYKAVVEDEEKAPFLTPEYRQIAKRAAEESAVLLKNDGILPLAKEAKKIALVGPFADNHEIIGFWACNGRDEESVTIYEGLKAALPEAEIIVAKGCACQWNDLDRSGMAEAIQAAKEADVVILCLGEDEKYAGEGNCRTDLRLPGLQEELATEVAKCNPNTVAVTFSGRPLVLTELEPQVKAILHMWFPGTEGGNAVASLLTGQANPSGKLSMTFPQTVGQCPIYYNRLNTGRPKNLARDNEYFPYSSNYIDCGNLPLYSFGHGLSYSNFVYESLELSADSMTKDDQIQVTITVRNDSPVAGKETVMLYMRDLFASNSRPVQQLIDFKKVDFAAGERKEITFTIKEEMLRFWNNEQKFVSEPGEFDISTGYADHLLLTKRMELKA